MNTAHPLCRATGRSLDVLVCNAAVYLPTAKEPSFNADGVELSVMTNHLGHFLLANLMLEDLQKGRDKSAKSNGTTTPAPRLIIVGSITGNTNTLAGEDCIMICNACGVAGGWLPTLTWLLLPLLPVHVCRLC